MSAQPGWRCNDCLKEGLGSDEAKRHAHDASHRVALHEGLNGKPVTVGRHKPWTPHGRCSTHRVYRMTCADMDALVQRSQGRCELCLEPGFGWRGHIDHQHETGAVRGLICPKCNAHMRRVDSGERPIDSRVQRYLALAAPQPLDQRDRP